jgi:hypothetical protein
MASKKEKSNELAKRAKECSTGRKPGVPVLTIYKRAKRFFSTNPQVEPGNRWALSSDKCRMSTRQGHVSTEQGRMSTEQGRMFTEQGRMFTEQGRMSTEQMSLVA